MSLNQTFYQKMLAQQLAKKAAAEGSSSDGAAAAAAPPAPAAPTLAIEPLTVKTLSNPVVLVSGSTNYLAIGKRPGEQTDAAPNLLGPHRLLSGFDSVKITFLATGGNSGHVIALGGGGEVFAWGRNESGQLGHGDLIMRPGPARVSALNGSKVTAASTGKVHTVFLTDAGDVLACGSCKQGAVGNGAPKKTENQTKPAALNTGGAKFSTIASGSNFNLAIDSIGDVWAWGWSEFGVLGNGDDGEHNTADGAVKLSYLAETSPSRVRTLEGLKNVHVACGQHHCAAIDGEGVVYTWGNGGYGRLGHKDQNNQLKPKPLTSYLRARFVACGSAHTIALGWPVMANGTVCTGVPTTYMWGKCRGATQNAWMYPQAEEDLRGWSVQAVSVGSTHTVVHADSSVIAWGSACASGELGFGQGGKKSSARPAKVDSLESAVVGQVSCGPANTFLLVESGPVSDELPEWVPAAAAEEEAEEPAASSSKATGKAKRPAQPAAGGKAKKGKK